MVNAFRDELEMNRRHTTWSIVGKHSGDLMAQVKTFDEVVADIEAEEAPLVSILDRELELLDILSVKIGELSDLGEKILSGDTLLEEQTKEIEKTISNTVEEVYRCRNTYNKMMRRCRIS